MNSIKMFLNKRTEKELKFKKGRLPKAAALVFLLTPFSFLFAQSVYISEIAWMGNNSYTDEWIELYNNSNSNIDLSGWIISFADDSSDILLEGVIESKDFFILERTDDNSIPNISADQIYTGSLDNSGETIFLYSENGIEEDKIVSGENWKNVGGDNDTKETAQKTSTGWITASPTPGALNSQSVSSDSQNDNQGQNQRLNVKTNNLKESQNTNSSYSDYPEEQQIYADAGPDLEAIAGASFFFEGEAYGIQKKPLEGAKYEWNFGDGNTGNGKRPMHHYDYPGVYVAFLSVSSGGYSDIGRVEVDVLPALIEIKNANKNFIEISNDLNTELDLSMWYLRVGDKHFTFPKNTIILPNSSIKFSSSVTGLKAKNGKAFLLYPNGKIAASSTPSIKETKVVSYVDKAKNNEKNEKKRKINPAQTYKKEENNTENQESSSKEVSLNETNPKEGNKASALDSFELNGGEKGSLKWFLALLAFVGISSISAASFYKKMKEKQENTEEKEVFEEDEEDDEDDIEIID